MAEEYILKIAHSDTSEDETSLDQSLHSNVSKLIV